MRIIWRKYTKARLRIRSYKYGYGEKLLYIRIYTYTVLANPARLSSLPYRIHSGIQNHKIFKVTPDPFKKYF